jgi:hypothetical protein
MQTVTIREDEGEFFATLEDSDLRCGLLEGFGETAADALRDLAEIMEATA